MFLGIDGEHVIGFTELDEIVTGALAAMKPALFLKRFLNTVRHGNYRQTPPDFSRKWLHKWLPVQIKTDDSPSPPPELCTNHKLRGSHVSKIHKSMDVRETW